MKATNPPINWLLTGEPWVEYGTRIELLGQAADAPEVIRARAAMLTDAPISNLVTKLAAWPGPVLASHRSASQFFHLLTFLAELGLTVDDPGMEAIIARILEHQSTEGPFQIRMNIPVHFGGTGGEQWAWALCDAPLIVYALVKFGLGQHPMVVKAVEYLHALVADNGWRCIVAKELGRFRGPGRPTDPCPFANLAMLKMLSVVDELQSSPACRRGAETLLTLWSASQTLHPFMFFMGTDFRKLKVPFVWYDLMHVLEVLSRFAWLRNDPRLLEMLTVMRTKADEQGQFTPESVYLPWKNWEFGQKKVPSRWLTLQAWRIIRRFDR